MKSGSYSSSTIGVLERETYNTRYSMSCMDRWCTLNPVVSIMFLEALRVTSENIFAFVLGEKEVVQLLTSSINCHQIIIRSLNIEENKDLNFTLLQHASHTFIQTTIFTSHLVPTEAMQLMKQAEPLVDKMGSTVTLQHFERFYYILAHCHHEIGNIVEEVDCHTKILMKLNEIQKCGFNACSCDAIGRAFNRTKNYELCTYYFQLYLRHQNISDIQQADALLTLYSCQSETGNHSGVNSTARQLLNLSSPLLENNIAGIYANIILYAKIDILYWSHGWSDEARKIEHRMLAVLKNVSIYGENVCNVLYNIVQLLFSAKNFVAVPSFAHCALNLCKNINDSNVKSTAKWSVAELYLTLGLAEFHNKNKSLSISNLRLALTYSEVSGVRIACKALLLQVYVEKMCLQRAWEEMKNVVYSTYLLIADTYFDVEYFSLTMDNPYFQDTLLYQQDTKIIYFLFHYILLYSLQCLWNLLLRVVTFLILIIKLTVILKIIFASLTYILYISYRTVIYFYILCKGIRLLYAPSYVLTH